MPHRVIGPNGKVNVGDGDHASRVVANWTKVALALALPVVLASLLLSLYAPGAEGAVTCNKYAATNGSDGAPGTSSRPFRTAQRLADSLAAGQAGCLRGGTYSERDKNVNIKRPRITLRGAPGAAKRATINARVNVAKGADGVRISGLRLAGAPGFVNVLVRANNTRLVGNTITNGHRHSSCVLVGSRYGRDAAVATGTLISGNQIHDCGRLPRSNHDHGIYVSAGRGTSIVNNGIYNNADRGVQLYPDGDGTRIQGNRIRGNGQGIIVSGSGKHVSSNNSITGNTIVNSKAGWNVTTNWNQTPRVGKGSVARNNCLWTLRPNSFYGQRGGINPKSPGLQDNDNRISARCA